MRKLIILFILSFSYLYSQDRVEFSHKAGFYDSPFYLKVNSEFGDVLYSYQNNINRRSRILKDSILIDKNTAISFGLNTGDSVLNLGSQSYFIDFNTDFSVVSLMISNKSFYDSVTGLYMHGPNAYYDTTLKVMLNSNYSKKSEREIHVEIFNSLGERIIQQDAGVRIFGGMTIYYPEKSLRIIARNIYGKSRFKADLFNKGAKKYKQFILRHSGNDYRKTRFKDAMSTTIASKSGLDVQASTPSHLFVNSEYWGIYNIREKINEYYIDNNYNCGTEGIDMLQAFKLVEEGTVDKYQKLLDFVSNNNISDEENYKYLNSLMDCHNFAKFWIHQVYFGNKDVRGNIRFWRSDSLDGRFRWIVYDTDLGWGSYKSNLLEDFTSPIKTHWYNPTWSTFLLRNLLSNTFFRDYFINQTAFLLSTSLHTDNVKSVINDFEETYRSEMEYHHRERKKFQRYQGSMKVWQKEVNELKFFALKRDEKLYDQIKEKFNLSDLYTLKININNHQNGLVLLNENNIETSEFSGRFFKGVDLPLRISPNLGYTYFGWDNMDIVNLDSNDIMIDISFVKNKESEKKVIFNEIDYVNDCFEIFNQQETQVNLKDWKLIDKNNNLFEIQDDFIIDGRSFVIFHLNDMKTKNNVMYQKINFGLSSENEFIALYDEKGDLVDSVSYYIEDIDSSYSRNIPFSTFNNIIYSWENNSDITIGYHNSYYTDLLSNIEEDERKRKQRFIFYIILSIVFILIFILYIVYRRRTILKS